MENKISLDAILSQVGKFGRLQLLYYAMICYMLVLSGTYNVSYVFTASDLNYRCYINSCDDEKSLAYNADWVSNAVPYDEDTQLPSQCYKFGYLGVYFNPENKTLQYCSPDNFDRETVVKCSRFVYENDERTILNEFELNCDENKWKLALPGTIRSIGLIFNLFLIGYVSDRFGRKTAFILSPLMAATIGLAQTFAWSYWSYIGLKFLEALLGAGTYSSGVILAIEFVSPQYRAISATLIFASASTGKVYLGLVAMLLQNWKWMKRVNYIPSYLAVTYIWLLPESLRWLLTKQKFIEISKILLRIIKWNNVEISDEMRDLITNRPDLIEHDMHKTKKYPIGEVFRSRRMLVRLIGLSFCWTTNVFIFYGLQLISVSIGGNKYTNFMITAFMDIPACLFVMLISNRIGRKKMLCSAFFVTGFGLLVYPYVKSIHWTRLAIFMIGKFAITVAFTTTYIYTSELLPTNLRHTLLGICSAFGRLGSVLAPQAPLLELVMKNLSIYLFSGAAITAGLLSLQFPETLNTPLPDTIDEALHIGKRRYVNKDEEDITLDKSFV